MQGFLTRRGVRTYSLLLSILIVAALTGCSGAGDLFFPADGNPEGAVSRGLGTELITNGDFSNGLTGWSTWTERYHLTAAVQNGAAKVSGTDINGGIYQQFQTGGTGTHIDIGGFWQTDPSVANAQWAEVLVINGSRLPVNGSDVNAGQSDVVMIYKNDTWTSGSGWSGEFDQTAPVNSTGYFIAAGTTATIVLKTGNLQGVTSGVSFDNISVVSHASGVIDPTAAASATPVSGTVPLTVTFDGAGSSCDPSETLTYAWTTGDGGSSTVQSFSYVYDTAGTYTATLTVTDSRGVFDSDSVVITVNDPSNPSNLVSNGDFSSGTNGWTLWQERGTTSCQVGADGKLSTSGTDYNGGVYQQFQTGGAGNIIEIGGFWESTPTVANAQWGEVLVINGTRVPAAGQPVDSSQADVVLVYKNDTWTSGAGWSGEFDQTAPVVDTGRFTATGDTATIVLKSGNIQGVGQTGVKFDSIEALVTGYTDPDPQIPAGKSKLSLHSGAGNLTSSFVSQAQPTTLKLLDNFGYAATAKQVSPDTLIVGRIFLAQQPVDGNPVTRAQEWWTQCGPIILQYPAVDYWEGYNEVDVSTVAKIQWYAQFEAERVRILASNGRKACIANFSLGTPDVQDPQAWPAFYPAIDAALANGGILGLHEYGTPMQQYFDFETGEGWLCGRYRKVYRQFLIPDGREIPLVITETGVDNEHPVGWKNWFTEEEYLSQLMWYDGLLKADDYVLGAHIFAVEIPGWFDFDIAPIIPELTAYVRDSGQ